MVVRVCVPHVSGDLLPGLTNSVIGVQNMEMSNYHSGLAPTSCECVRVFAHVHRQ